MIDICYHCGQSKANIDPDLVMLDREINYYQLKSLPVGDVYTQTTWNHTLLSGEKFTVLQKQVYAQECQGETTDCFVVFRREKTGKTYKKLAQGDSYGEIEWDGALVEVQVAKKMVETWEVVD